MYISLRNLGSSANLCSQVQQYASLYAIAKETNKEIVLPLSTKNDGFGIQFDDLLDIRPFVRYEDDSFFENFKSKKINEKEIVDKTVFDLNKDENYFIDGIFNLFHYWYPKYTYSVLYNWKWNEHYEQMASLNLSMLKSNIQDKEFVSIHVRRGDYMNHHHFVQLGMTNYYQNALEILLTNNEIDKYHFVIFSDDIEWCKSNFDLGSNVTFLDARDPKIDLIMMSKCNHHIIANSSYSWFAAMKHTQWDIDDSNTSMIPKINDSSVKIICPRNYLMKYSEYAYINGNYYPESWIAIDNEN